LLITIAQNKLAMIYFNDFISVCFEVHNKLNSD